MAITLIGDAHLGVRFPFTTPESHIRFRKLQLDIANEALELAKQKTGGSAVFLGDLFDKYSVSDVTLVDGFSLLNNAVAVIAGNHDIAKNEDKPSAIRLLAHNLHRTVILDGPSILHDTSVRPYAVVPHCTTQEGFERALEASTRGNDRVDTLFLHCNFGEPKGVETENYLSSSKASDLLKRFKRIISGHEHDYSTPVPGVTMLGSILPMNFGEMTDKFIGVLYDDGELILHKVWDAAKHFRQIPAGQVESFSPTEEHFLEVTGTVTVDEAALINKRIKEWYKVGIIAVKNSTQLLRTEREVEHKADATTWESEVAAQLTDTQRDLFNEILEQCHV